MKTLENHLQNLYASQLEDFALELGDSRIRFKTAKPEADLADEVVFEGVKAFFYSNPASEALLNEKPTELSSIVFCDSGFGEFAVITATHDGEWQDMPMSVSIPNFNLCFGEASFFIEAKSVTINENRFSLKPQH